MVLPLKNDGDETNNPGGSQEPPITHAAQSQAEVLGVSVGLRIPPIWRDKLRAWFAHFEAIVSSQKKSDQAMYELVLGQLERQDVDEIYDMLLRPPETNKYQTIKQRLLEVYEESEQQNVQRVLAGMELGDLKPSQLFRRMQNLAGNHLSEVTLRGMWLKQLPSNVSSVLALSESASIRDVTQMADKMMEQQAQHQISAVYHKHDPEAPSTSQQELYAVARTSPPSPVKHRFLEDKIDRLTEAITQLVIAQTHNLRGRSPQRNWRGRGRSGQWNRSRSQSMKRGLSSHRSATSNASFCYYHQRFGPRAYKCEEPCTYHQQTHTPATEN